MVAGEVGRDSLIPNRPLPRRGRVFTFPSDTHTDTDYRTRNPTTAEQPVPQARSPHPCPTRPHAWNPLPSRLTCNSIQQPAKPKSQTQTYIPKFHIPPVKSQTQTQIPNLKSQTAALPRCGWPLRTTPGRPCARRCVRWAPDPCWRRQVRGGGVHAAGGSGGQAAGGRSRKGAVETMGVWGPACVCLRV